MFSRFLTGTSTSALPKEILHYEKNLTHVTFPSLMKERTRTIPFPIHHEGNLMNVIFHFIIKEITSAMPKKTTLHHMEI